MESKIRPGVTTEELDAAAEKYIRSQGAAPAFKGYRGFPGSICASPNSMVVHGIPGPYELKRGDIISVDIGVVLDGWVADAARTFPVGAESRRSPQQAAGRPRGVAVRRGRAVPARQPAGRRLPRRPDAGRGRGAVASCGRSSGTASAATCTRTRRSPTTATRARARCSRRAWCWRSSRWSTAGRHQVRMGDDDWAIYSQDGSLAAHFEFTVADHGRRSAGPHALARARRRGATAR